jgi:adenine C2-methylase RlmN of 23S rRNA A2503 and tRNA A37
MVVEHVLAGVKRCRIVKDVFRNRRIEFEDMVMEIACALHNFRQKLRSRLELVNRHYREVITLNERKGAI